MVAIPVTVFISLAFIFQYVTVVLPTFQYVFPGDRHMRAPQCAYKSPQSLGVLRSTLAFFHIISQRWKRFLSRYPKFEWLQRSSYLWSWPEFDVHWRSLRDTRVTSRDMPGQEQHQRNGYP
ncbi:hypothetical protein CPB84DRAFT_1774494 [Gymnopilus junonius]|uniref:Uncharacterized protein n=1 Tax=Gymnopilus junonius TaxID=109634 RepID=A0A9P5NS96_GYMJU|nr:hypothetical protein CPB84DRAFT_1774494 [Gymnopilus junonius]